MAIKFRSSIFVAQGSQARLPELEQGRIPCHPEEAWEVWASGVQEQAGLWQVQEQDASEGQCCEGTSDVWGLNLRSYDRRRFAGAIGSYSPLLLHAAPLPAGHGGSLESGVRGWKLGSLLEEVPEGEDSFYFAGCEGSQPSESLGKGLWIQAWQAGFLTWNRWVVRVSISCNILADNVLVKSLWIHYNSCVCSLGTRDMGFHLEQLTLQIASVGQVSMDTLFSLLQLHDVYSKGDEHLWIRDLPVAERAHACFLQAITRGREVKASPHESLWEFAKKTFGAAGIVLWVQEPWRQGIVRSLKNVEQKTLGCAGMVLEVQDPWRQGALPEDLPCA